MSFLEIKEPKTTLIDTKQVSEKTKELELNKIRNKEKEKNYSEEFASFMAASNITSRFYDYGVAGSYAVKLDNIMGQVFL